VNAPITLPDSGDLCKPYTCDPVGGIGVTPIVCEDNDICTTNVCTAGVCSYPPRDCSDADECTVNSCDATKGGCISVPLVCTDDNTCDQDVCDSDIGCVHTPISPIPIGECFVSECEESSPDGWVTVPSGNCPSVFKCTPTDSLCLANRTAFIIQNLPALAIIASTSLGTTYTAGSAMSVPAPDGSGAQFQIQIVHPVGMPFNPNSPTVLAFLATVASQLLGYHPDTATLYMELVITPVSGTRDNVRINFLFPDGKKRTLVDTIEANIPASISSPNSVGLIALSVVAVVFIVYVVKQRQ